MKTTYPAPGYLANATDAASSRKSLMVPKTNLSDDSVSVEYDSSNTSVLVAHTTDADNVEQIQADSDGVSYRKNVGGTWQTVPQAVSTGGTGATTAADARTNLGLSPTAISITAGSNVTMNSNNSFKIGNVGFLSAAFTVKADSITILGTLASGSRPSKSFYGNALNENNAVQSIGIGSNGQILIGGSYVKNVQYRINMVYQIA